MHLRPLPWLILTLGLALLPGPVSGSRGDDRERIRQLAGCFEVEYRFVEDGERDIFGPDFPFTQPVREWIDFQPLDRDIFVLQHVFVLGDRVMPHWHEVWTWRPDQAAWTQEVRAGTYEPEAALRYNCTAPWSLNRWECHAGEAARPVRDLQRGDYARLDRHNILLVTPNGWVHSQHNIRLRGPGSGADADVVSHELGWITYTRLPDGQCHPASEQYPIHDAR